MTWVAELLTWLCWSDWGRSGSVGSRAERLHSPPRLVTVAALKTLHGEIGAARRPATRDRSVSGKEVLSMDEVTARAMIQAHFEASNVGAAGGGPGDDIARASEIYADDAVVEWPQGGERLRGKANIIAFRSSYPARQQFELHRTTGCHDLWVNEYTIRYDDQAVMAVGIMEFRDDKVVRERIYFGDPWEPPAWRAHWVERFDPREQLGG
jgi:hypothetical protein